MPYRGLSREQPRIHYWRLVGTTFSSWRQPGALQSFRRLSKLQKTVACGDRWLPSLYILCEKLGTTGADSDQAWFGCVHHEWRRRKCVPRHGVITVDAFDIGLRRRDNLIDGTLLLWCNAVFFILWWQSGHFGRVTIWIKPQWVEGGCNSNRSVKETVCILCSCLARDEACNINLIVWCCHRQSEF